MINRTTSFLWCTKFGRFIISAVQRIPRWGENQGPFTRLTKTLNRPCEISEWHLPPQEMTVCTYITFLRYPAGYYIHVLFVAFFHNFFRHLCHIEVPHVFPSSLLYRLTQFCLRVYAITCQNKSITTYFGVLLLVRLAMPLGITFSRSPVVIKFSPTSVGGFNLCGLQLVFTPSWPLALCLVHHHMQQT